MVTSPSLANSESEFSEKILAFLDHLQIDSKPGRYRLCRVGITNDGERLSLAMSCFALKVYVMLNAWDKLDVQVKVDWINYINSFQVAREVIGNTVYHNAFINQELMAYLNQPSFIRSIRSVQSKSIREIIRIPFGLKSMSRTEQVVISETKQAIATLSEVGKMTLKPYESFPKSNADIFKFMSSLDWSLPWAAGGQAASLAVFLNTEANRLLGQDLIQRLTAANYEFFTSIVDPKSGCYFKGRQPPYASIVNGTMKVLTALDWLDSPIHYPEKLIDTTLRQLPASDGCNLVDAVYVLFRCTRITDYRKSDVIDYAKKVETMVHKHYNLDHGFSYYIGRAQKWYSGLKVSKGYRESDLHGTVLLLWAYIMIQEICYPGKFKWNVIRP